MEAYKRKIAFKELFEFEGYKVSGILRGSDRVELCLKKVKQTGCCPLCQLKRRTVIERDIRTVRDVDLLGKQCYLRMEIDRISCSCGYRGMDYPSFITKYARCTKRFAEYVALLCEKMSLKDVAEVARIDWKTAKRIDKEGLKKLKKDLCGVHPTRIGIDEIAYEKRHKYLTIVRDIDGGVIWIGQGRQKEALDQFFAELGKEKSMQITVAVMDMWDPFIASVHEHTQATLVFDKFHVAKRVNEAVDAVRKKEFAHADEQERKEMKHKRFLILARQKRLDDEEREKLDDLMRLNKTLYKAYLLKEQVLDIFSEAGEDTAAQRLITWIENVAQSGISSLIKVVQTIEHYFYGILNFFRCKVTNAASEGFNTKITVIKRRAYGFRDIEYFKLKILQSCSRN